MPDLLLVRLLLYLHDLPRAEKLPIVQRSNMAGHNDGSIRNLTPFWYLSNHLPTVSLGRESLDLQYRHLQVHLPLLCINFTTILILHKNFVGSPSHQLFVTGFHNGSSS
jgi:hypothetical protein